VDFKVSQLAHYVSDDNQDLREIKQSFLQGVIPSGCQGCQEHNWYSQFLGQVPIGTNDFNLLSLDLRWSNTCNLTCMYCGSGNSSAWAALSNRSSAIPIAVSNRIQDKEILINLIQQHQSTLQRVSLLGGEPLLIKENIRVLELLSPTIEVSIFTGLNVDLETNRLYHMLLDMPNVYWTISMENVGKKFEFVRRGAQWSKQVANLEHLLANNRSRYTVNFQSQFCAYSATSIEELYDFASGYDLKVNWNWLSHPKELDFFFFPDRLKQASLAQLDLVKNKTASCDHQIDVDDITEKLRSSLGQGSEEQVARCRQFHIDTESRFFHNAFDFVALWPEFKL
jgi:organic radical activating enzyme